MPLAIIRYIKQYGLEKALSDFSLKSREYPHKVHLKYDTIESPFDKEEVRDCRGLVLRTDTWDVVSMSFRKFFNFGEGHAAKVDWENARVYKKLDGTMIHAYTDPVTGKVCFGTTGTADGEGDVDNFHHYSSLGGTFSDLFVHAYLETTRRNGANINLQGIDADILVRAVFLKYAGLTLTFELCTPFNQVVTPHKESSVYLLAGRRLDTLEELSHEELESIAKDLYVPLAPTEFLRSDPEELKITFEGMPYSDEGYVVCDSLFNRVKIKNPAYCTIHFFKDSTAFWRIVDIVRGGDDNVNEYKATFPGREAEIDYLQIRWKDAIASLEDMTRRISEDGTVRTYIDYKAGMKVSNKDIPDSYKEKLTKAFSENVVDFYDVPFIKIAEVLDILPSQAKDVKRRILQIRDDQKAVDLRKSVAMKLTEWTKANGQTKHLGFLFSFVEGSSNPKRYLMNADGKSLYKELIKGFDNKEKQNQ